MVPTTRAFRAATLLAVLGLGLSACSGTKVTRVRSDSTIDLSGRWNDADSRMVAEEMLKDCLDRPWYQSWVARGKIPTLVVGNVRNLSHEHIDPSTFMNDIQRVLINSGKVEIVADRTQRQELRDEIASQAGNATEDTRKQAGLETGADLLLGGTINSIVDREGGESVVFYQVDLELIDLQTQRKLWIGNKKIKKFVDRDAVGL